MNPTTPNPQDKPESEHPTFDEADRAIEAAYLEDLARANAYADFIEVEALRFAEEDDEDSDEMDPWTMGDQMEADGDFDR